MNPVAWFVARERRRRDQEQADTEAANVAARTALPSRSLPDASSRPTVSEEVDAEVCALCKALVDPDGVVQHRRFHDALVPAFRIGDQS